MTSGGWLRLAVMAPCLVIAAPATAAEEENGSGIDIDLDVTAFRDSNVTLAELDNDIAADAGLEAEVTWSRSEPALEGGASGWSLGVKGVKFDEFEDLDRVELKAGWRYTAQFRRGFSAAVYELSADARLIDSVSDLRDGWEITLGAMMTRRLTTRLVGRMGLRALKREADEFRTFDNRRGNLFFNGDLRTGKRTVVYGTYILSEGDVVSTAQPNFRVIDAAQVIEPDDAFGGLLTNRFAYRLDATVHILTLGWNQTLWPSTSLDVSFQGLVADAEGDNEYERGMVRLGFLHRF